MKNYMKPTLDIIELRPEERLAHCRWKYVRPHAWFFWSFFCFKKYTNGSGSC